MDSNLPVLPACLSSQKCQRLRLQTGVNKHLTAPKTLPLLRLHQLLYLSLLVPGLLVSTKSSQKLCHALSVQTHMPISHRASPPPPSTSRAA